MNRLNWKTNLLKAKVGLGSLGSLQSNVGIQNALVLKHLIQNRSFGSSIQVLKVDPKFTAKHDPEMTASEIWTNRQKGAKVLPKHIEKDSPFYHPDNTNPMRKPNISIGPLHAPLKVPEYDQSLRSTQESGLPSPPAYYDFKFDDAALSEFSKDYPRLKLQYTELRDPYKYWDVQGRRDYGELVQENDLFLDKWSPGPSSDPRKPIAILLGAFTLVFGLYKFCEYVINKNPISTLASNVAEYPFDNLSKETGGLSDRFVTREARKLKESLSLKE